MLSELERGLAFSLAGTWVEEGGSHLSFADLQSLDHSLILRLGHLLSTTRLGKLFFSNQQSPSLPPTSEAHQLLAHSLSCLPIFRQSIFSCISPTHDVRYLQAQNTSCRSLHVLALPAGSPMQMESPAIGSFPGSSMILNLSRVNQRLPNARRMLDFLGSSHVNSPSSQSR